MAQGDTFVVMLQPTYDANADGVADKSEGIPILPEVPADLSIYADGDMFKVDGKLYVVEHPV